jgi:tRNA (Thr-GGU) A37 N-methylase
MFKNLLLGVSLIVTVANISPAQAQTTVVSKVKNKIKGFRTKTHTTLTQLITKHDHPHHLNTISSVITDAVAEKENVLPLDLTKGLPTPKGDIRSKIGFFNSFFGSNAPKNELLDPAVKERKLTQKSVEKVDKVELEAEPKMGSRSGPVEKATPLPNAPAMKVTLTAPVGLTSSLQKTNINEGLTRIQLKKSPMRASILPDREKHSMPWGSKLTPSQIKALEKAKKTDAMPTPMLNLGSTLDLPPALDLTPMIDIKDELEKGEAQTSDASDLLLRTSTSIDTSSIDATQTSTVDLNPVVGIKDEVKASEAQTLDASDLLLRTSTSIDTSSVDATQLSTVDLTPMIDIKDELEKGEAQTSDASDLLLRTSTSIDTSSVDATQLSTVDLNPVVDIKDELEKGEITPLNAPPPPPPPPMPPSGRKFSPKEVSLTLEGELDTPLAKMDKASSVSAKEPDERSNLLAAIRQGKTLKKAPQAGDVTSDESSLMRIDETIITTAGTVGSNGDQNNELFAGLFKTIGNFLKVKSTSTLDDPDLRPLEGARFKDYSVSYKHTIDDGFSESTFLLYFTSEAAKNSYIKKISSFDNEEDEKDFAESYSLSPAQTHIRQLHEKRLTEVKRLEDKTADALRRAQAVQKPADEIEQEKITATKITPTPGPTAPTLKTDGEGSENLAPKTHTGGTDSKTARGVGDLLNSIKGFTHTALKKVTNLFKPAEKPKNDLEEKMLSRRNKMGYNDKDDLDWD